MFETSRFEKRSLIGIIDAIDVFGLIYLLLSSILWALIIE